MTQVHVPVIKSNSEIAEQVRDIHPLRFAGRVLLVVVGFPFTALGWITGAAWFALCFSVIWAYNRTFWLGQCVRVGFYKGARYKYPS